MSTSLIRSVPSSPGTGSQTGNRSDAGGRDEEDGVIAAVGQPTRTCASASKHGVIGSARDHVPASSNGQQSRRD